MNYLSASDGFAPSPAASIRAGGDYHGVQRAAATDWMDGDVVEEIDGILGRAVRGTLRTLLFVTEVLSQGVRAGGGGSARVGVFGCGVWIAPHPPTPLWNGSLTSFPLGLCVRVWVGGVPTH